MKKKILLLSDSIRVSTGVGTMAREIVHNTVDKFDWVQLCPEVDTLTGLERLDISGEIQRITGVEDASVVVIPYTSFGDIQVLRLLLKTEKPDAIMLFTDPSRWVWLFEHEKEIRQQVPIIFYNIWDNLPVPHYNRPYYESVDSLIAISDLTRYINLDVLKHSDVETTVDYVPHGVDENVFYPVEADEIIDFFRHEVVGDTDFVVFWNSRNMDRKNPLDVINEFAKFKGKYRTKATLLMHTQIASELGTDLQRYIDDCIPKTIAKSIIFSTEHKTAAQMNSLYNIADVTVNISSNEGWGLSVTESLMAGTPVIVNHTGGIMDQVSNNNLENGGWSETLFPTSTSLYGTLESPYINASRVKDNDLSEALYRAYKLKPELPKLGARGRQFLIDTRKTAKHMATDIAYNISETIKYFKKSKTIRIFKI